MSNMKEYLLNNRFNKSVIWDHGFSNFDVCGECPWAHNDADGNWICNVGELVDTDEIDFADDHRMLIDCEIIEEEAGRLEDQLKRQNDVDM